MSIPFINLKAQYQNNKHNIDSAISKVLEHGQYIMGPEVLELESALSEYVDVKHTLSCSSGTDALVLPLMAEEIGLNDAVFTTPFTFFATAESISLVGATPVFVDIDPQTYNIDPIKLEEQIEQTLKAGKLKPRAIIAVDLFGLPADYCKISEIAKKHNLVVIEDAAQAFGAPYKNKKAGSLADYAATSFYPAKPLGCYGDGGAVFTDDEEKYELLQSLRVHGQARSGDKYDNVRIGINGRMDSIQAAVLLEKLKLYDEEILQRNRVAQAYSSSLSETVIKPHIPDELGSVWAQYSIQVPDREKLRADLGNEGIPTAVFYPIPIHLSTAYQWMNHKEGDFPVSEKISTKIISLPMHPYLTNDEVASICAIVNRSVTDD